MYKEMMRSKLLMFMIVVMGIFQTFGQDGNIEETSSALVERLGPEIIQVNFETQAARSTIVSNSIYIQQIGSGNSALTHIQAEGNELNLVQNGNSNRSKIDVTGKTVVHNLIQNGNNNFMMEYGNSPSLNLERNIIQNGNDHGVVIFGSNSLTDNIILNLQGSSKTITIRNFN